jgi:5-methylcytosine-specific restriction endonuclease McrA
MQRSRIFERDGYRCAYCGEQYGIESLSVDHVQPVVHGGDHSAGNLVTACMACNTLKGHMRPGDFLRQHPAAQQHFFALARHVWPRILRAIRQDLESDPAA